MRLKTKESSSLQLAFNGHAELAPTTPPSSFYRLSFRMQGFNKYYAPDFDPNKTSSLNAYHGKHALGDRARKVSFNLHSPSFLLFNLLPTRMGGLARVAPSIRRDSVYRQNLWLSLYVQTEVVG